MWHCGQTRAIAVSTSKRVKVLPDVPTVGETNPGFAVSTWYGCVVRAGPPDEIVQQLSSATLKVIALPDVQAALANRGATVDDYVGANPQFARSALARFSPADTEA